MTNNAATSQLELIEEDFRLDSYDFPFSERLIADRPAVPRDASRLLVLERNSGALHHEHFRDLAHFLRSGDCLVLNRTKVWPARLLGRKTTGGKIEMLLLRELAPGSWAALSSDLKPGVTLRFPGNTEAKADIEATVERLNSEGEWECRFSTQDVRGFMARQGLPPLPTYILKKRANRDVEKADFAAYQTVFASEEGSIAAPTAGLHFTPAIFEQLRGMGVRVAEITLHVGHGTFKPVNSADIREHRMKSEWYRIEESAISALESARKSGGRILSVGTTATRTLETFAQTGRREGWSDMFIYPGHRFHFVDALVTNFHFPRSTPLLLASAFAGKERLLNAYREAVEQEYRFYSYGDAMLIV